MHAKPFCSPSDAPRERLCFASASDPENGLWRGNQELRFWRCRLARMNSLAQLTDDTLHGETKRLAGNSNALSAASAHACSTACSTAGDERAALCTVSDTSSSRHTKVSELGSIHSRRSAPQGLAAGRGALRVCRRPRPALPRAVRVTVLSRAPACTRRPTDDGQSRAALRPPQYPGSRAGLWARHHPGEASTQRECDGAAPRWHGRERVVSLRLFRREKRARKGSVTNLLRAGAASA